MSNFKDLQGVKNVFGDLQDEELDVMSTNISDQQVPDRLTKILKHLDPKCVSPGCRVVAVRYENLKPSRSVTADTSALNEQLLSTPFFHIYKASKEGFSANVLKHLKATLAVLSQRS